MPTDLSLHIQSQALADTHEHLRKEKEWVEEGPADVLCDLFANYVPADLISAGATAKDVQNLTDPASGSINARFSAIRPAWSAIRHTGYGEAVHILADEVYGLGPDWDLAWGSGSGGLDSAQAQLAAWRQPGGRLQLLQQTGGIDHCQTDDFCWPCHTDASGPDFFFYDINWADFCNGQISPEKLAAETGVTVTDLASLGRAMASIFTRHGARAIAVKAQHAYSRTLSWQERSDAEAAAALETTLRGGTVDEATRLLLGDWCWARGVELAIEHDLPFKLHTGYYAGTDRMPVHRIQAGNLCPLLAKYLDCRFVLMHIAYPYSQELVALTKHYRNVYADLCWAWSIDPYSGMDFVRRFLHTAPANKLFAFGGDTSWPTSAVAYAIQARRWLTRALEAETNDGLLTERQAIALATRLMHTNQYECFRIAEKKASAT
ncbi:MAG: amidohydrolase family protein [bacterium]|nr:amidohydrolase family protein [bacterium]